MNETRLHRHRQEPEPASIGWFFLGLFIPIVGLILFLAWFRDHHRKAVRAGLGALTTFIIGIIASIGFAFFAISEVKKITQEPATKQLLSSSHHHNKIKHSTSSSVSASHSSNTDSGTSTQEAASSTSSLSSRKATNPSQHPESHASSVSSYSSSVSGSDNIATDLYTVKAGDNLYRVAVNHGMTFSELLQLNGLSSDASISAGETLKVRE